MRYGGATDATNVIRTTKMAVLTSISLDHVGVLGDDLLEIAANKAGIIKPGAIVVMGRQEPQVEDAVWAICMEKGNPFIAAKPQEAVVRDVTVEHQTFRYHGARSQSHSQEARRSKTQCWRWNAFRHSVSWDSM